MAYIEPSQHLNGELFLKLLKGFLTLRNVTRSSVLVVVGVLYLPLHFIIIVIVVIAIIIITFTVNIFFIIFIFTRIFIKSSLLFLWGKLTCLVLFLSVSSSVLNWSTRPSFRVDPLPRYYRFASFTYGDMKPRDIGRMFYNTRVILCLIVSVVIIESSRKV